MSQVVGNTPRLEKTLFKEKARIFVKKFIEKMYNGWFIASEHKPARLIFG